MTTTFSCSSSGPEYGSAAKTSIAAPATLPESSASRSASSSTSFAARDVHDADPVLRRRKLLAPEEAARLLGQRQVEREEVRGGEHLLERARPVDAERTEGIRRDIRVVGEHAHLEAERPARDLLADPAEADETERLAGELEPAEARPLHRPLFNAACACGMLRESPAGGRSCARPPR